MIIWRLKNYTGWVSLLSLVLGSSYAIIGGFERAVCWYLVAVITALWIR